MLLNSNSILNKSREILTNNRNNANPLQ